MIWQPHCFGQFETRMYRISTGREMRCGVSRVRRDREQLVTTVYIRETSRKVCIPTLEVDTHHAPPPYGDSGTDLLTRTRWARTCSSYILGRRESTPDLELRFPDGGGLGGFRFLLITVAVLDVVARHAWPLPDVTLRGRDERNIYAELCRVESRTRL